MTKRCFHKQDVICTSSCAAYETAEGSGEGKCKLLLSTDALSRYLTIKATKEEKFL